MLRISNTRVYDLKESVIASGNAMRLGLPEYTDEEFEKGLNRCKKLTRLGGGSGHSNYRTGIRVSFDIIYPQYWSMEAQRYHWLDIVTSMSKMHRLLKMDFDESCNEYVTKETKNQMDFLIGQYNGIIEAKDLYDSEEQYKDILYTQWMKIISNCPMGLELGMRVSTNYEQLATIYRQRKHHKLEEWHIFCNWVKSLPYSELITGDYGRDE